MVISPFSRLASSGLSRSLGASMKARVARITMATIISSSEKPFSLEYFSGKIISLSVPDLSISPVFSDHPGLTS